MLARGTLQRVSRRIFPGLGAFRLPCPGFVVPGREVPVQRAFHRACAARAEQEKDEDMTRSLKDMSPEEAKRESPFGTIPNILTMIRMASSLPLAWLVVNDQLDWACGVFLFASALDYADGAIARSFPGQSSVLGSFLDPVADKVLIATGTVSLAAVGIIPVWVTGIILARDLGLVSAGFLYRWMTKPPDAPFFTTTRADSFQVTPSKLSKWNMALQVALVASGLANGAELFTPLLGQEGGDLLVASAAWLTAGTTLASWYGYSQTPTFRKFMSLLRERLKWPQ
jgi:cardiolipin synthase (CMP-forming)